MREREHTIESEREGERERDRERTCESERRRVRTRESKRKRVNERERESERASLTEPRGDQHAVDALDGLADAGHHGVHLLGQVVLDVQAQAGLLLELLQCVGPLAGRQLGAILGGGREKGIGYSKRVCS